MMCGYDLDDVFAFQTDKQVRVRHRWLGGIYYFGFLLVLLYTIIYQVQHHPGSQTEHSAQPPITAAQPFVCVRSAGRHEPWLRQD